MGEAATALINKAAVLINNIVLEAGNRVRGEDQSSDFVQAGVCALLCLARSAVT